MASQRPSSSIPVEHREIDDPGKSQQVGGSQLKAATELAAHPIEAGRDDRWLLSHQDQQIAWLSTQALDDLGELLGTQIPGEGCAELSALGDSDEDRAPCAASPYDLLQLIELPARIGSAARRTQAFNLSVAAQRANEDVEAGVGRQIAELDQLQAIA